MAIKTPGSPLLHDLHVALRQHARQRAFALTVVATLAVATGATAAVFAVVNTVVLRGLPFAAPDRLVWVASVRADNPNAPFTLPEYMDYRARTRTLSGLAAYGYWSASLAGDGVTERLTGVRLSANALEVLGVTPSAGRLLNDNDDRPGAPPVVVISYRLWQRQFGGAADVAGRTARINGAPYTIAGVLPPQFLLPLPGVDVITPLVPDRDPLRHERNSVNFLRFFGRLEPGASADQARAELTAICQALKQQFPVEYARKQAVNAVPLGDAIVGDIRPAMLWLLAAVVVVLVTALANLMALALVRANARRHELAVRVTLGASWWRMARQLSIEALWLAMGGTALGWLAASQMVAVAIRFAPTSIPRLSEVSLDWTAAVFVIAATVIVTLFLTAAPLAAIAVARAGDALRPASRGAIGDRWNHRVRNVMVVSEIAAALVLVLATLVLVQNLAALEDVHPGFETGGVFQARVSIPPAYRSPDDVSRFYDRLLERLAAAPGVTDVGVISVAPLSGLLATVPFTLATEATADRVMANLRAISPGYLTTVGTRVVQGRAFAETDAAGTPPVALVSAALADRFLPSGAIGQRLLINDNNGGPRPVEIVGVTENVRHTVLDGPASLDLYLPFRQLHPDRVQQVRDNQFWMVKTSSDPEAFRESFVAHLRAIDPDAAVSGTGSMQRLLDDWLGPRRFNLGLFSAFALTALLLAGVGLYGLVSYTVSQRAGEIGVRMAIGATQANVQWMILKQAARLGIAGGTIGLGLAALARPLVGGVVPDAAIGTVAMAGAASSLVAVVLVAAWLPARRAARIEPTRALRSE